MINFTVPGNPGVKKRPRFCRTGKFVKTYNPEENVSYENWVKLCYQQQVKHKDLFKESIKVTVHAYFDIPKAFSKVKRKNALSGLELPHNSKDVDNIAKIILDALNGIAYTDDHLITDLEVSKRYSDVPRVEVFIEKTLKNAIKGEKNERIQR